ncbi:unnamed protein product [Brassica rapa]|uniref:F-box domain-containing protein n=1 Tax=Brassica campestris TaxID=3711 RepID=A0A8D9LT81_BRACM|nr:unnamed protein product [Brassica rapa]
MLVERDYPHANVIDGKIYVAGDSNSTSPDWMEVFHPKTQTWELLPSLPAAEMRLLYDSISTSAGIDGKVHVFGSCNGLVYDTREGRWESADMEMSSEWVWFSYCVVENVIYVYNNEEFKWYDSAVRLWKVLKGLKGLPKFPRYTARLADFGGKLAVLWGRGVASSGYVDKIIWCAVIALERRSDQEIWGKVEWKEAVLKVPKSFGFEFPHAQYKRVSHTHSINRRLLSNSFHHISPYKMSSTAESSAAVNGDKPPHKKMTTQSPEISILSLPYDLLLNCLARVSRLYYPTLSLVSKKFRSVVASPDLYEARSLLHRTESCLYLCLRYDRDYPRNLDTYWFVLCRKPNRTVTDRSSGHLFIPVPSPQLRPARSMSLVAVGSNIYRIGGDMPSSSRVWVLDCRFNTWHRAPMMRLKRSSPAASLIDGKIYVAGGCEDPSSVNWIEVFDPKTRTWGNVANPGTETRPRAEMRARRDIHIKRMAGIDGKVHILGSSSRLAYDTREGRWESVGKEMSSG